MFFPKILPKQGVNINLMYVHKIIRKNKFNMLSRSLITCSGASHNFIEIFWGEKGGKKRLGNGQKCS